MLSDLPKLNKRLSNACSQDACIARAYHKRRFSRTSDPLVLALLGTKGITFKEGSNFQPAATAVAADESPKEWCISGSFRAI
ncbi:uncharacterized protein PHALS_00725 [Plasmopara halstedii]|uniref:Uncharacterized protein n=1 Tax=Plasmopara halstedii TaxID=4781 RepID=A0A0P1ASU8_PLAHL|nr:uncharacterized protein PHALS_00725 [Plasmopara halstedii]CEG44357.1 hypothetical protein PHALS_00725 [Plasmopara halstedii]|eukprot:XP_024580726.1 hypothetical protein PHALS_00725 [Plasmopara halstedii]